MSELSSGISRVAQDEMASSDPFYEKLPVHMLDGVQTETGSSGGLQPLISDPL